MKKYRVRKRNTLKFGDRNYVPGEILELRKDQASRLARVVEPAEGEIGDRLRKVRGDKSQDQFAALIGVNKNTVARYERMERTPDSAYLERVCAAFPEVSPAWLLTGEGWAERGALSDEKGGDLLLVKREEFSRLYEANCRISNPTPRDLALRAVLSRQISENLGLSEFEKSFVCQCGQAFLLTVVAPLFSGLSPLPRKGFPSRSASQTSKWSCPTCQRTHWVQGDVVDVEMVKA